MLYDTMKNGIANTIGATGVVLLIMMLVFIGPALFIWVVNSLAASGGSSFRIEHSLWNYFLALIALILVRGGSSSKSS